MKKIGDKVKVVSKCCSLDDETSQVKEYVGCIGEITDITRFVITVVFDDDRGGWDFVDKELEVTKSTEQIIITSSEKEIIMVIMQDLFKKAFPPGQLSVDFYVGLLQRVQASGPTLDAMLKEAGGGTPVS